MTDFWSPLIVTEPLAGSLTEVTISESPSTSVSLASTKTVCGVDSPVVAESSFACGSSFWPVTVTLTVATDVPPLPSVTV